MKIKFLLTLLFSLPVISCNISHLINYPDKKDIQELYEHKIIETINNKTYKLDSYLDMTFLGKDKENFSQGIIYSPLNSFIDETLSYNGFEEIYKPLSFKMPTKINFYVKNIIDELEHSIPSENLKSKYSISIFHNNESFIHNNYQKALEEIETDTEINRIDFNNERENQYINNYLERRGIKNKIKNLNIYSNDLIYTITNYDLNINNLFKNKYTKKSEFILYDKSKVLSEMYYSEEKELYYFDYDYDNEKYYSSSKGFRAVKLSLDNFGNKSLIFFTSLDPNGYNFNRNLFNKEDINTFLSNFKPVKGVISLPKFDLGSDISLGSSSYYIDKVPLEFCSKPSDKDSPKEFLNFLMTKEEICIGGSENRTRNTFKFDKGSIDYNSFTVRKISKRFYNKLSKAITSMTQANASMLFEFNKPFKFYLIDERLGLIIAYGDVDNPNSLFVKE